MRRNLEGEHGDSRARYGERQTQRKINVENIDCTRTFLSYDSENSSFESANEVHNGHGTSRRQSVMGNLFEDNHSTISDQSSDLGEIERDRVRQVFQEWMKDGVSSHSQSVSHTKNCSRAQWLGENERERVRIIREWVQMNLQQSCSSSPRDEGEGAPNVGSQFEQVRDGSLVNYSESGDRKSLHRYCGRQALLDLMMRSQRERERELQSLLECKPVSNFSYRNRIQSLLKGRFLRNETLANDERCTSSYAASELGFLRQKHTVSDLREEFLSRLVNNHCSAKDMQPNAPDNELNYCRSEGSQLNSQQEVIYEFYDQSELDNEEIGNDESRVVGTSESSLHEDVNQKSSVNQIAEQSDQIRGNEDIEPETSNFEFNGYVPQRENNSIENASVESVPLDVPEDDEPFPENDARRSEASDTYEVYGNNIHGRTRDTFGDYEWQVLLAQAEERYNVVTDHEESNLRQSEDPDELVIEHDGSQPLSASNHSEWTDHSSEGENDAWLDMSSGQNISVSMRGVDTFYLPDDDSVHSIELRELLSRRRVSNLLQSGFRESLDQLIQSYVERQGHGSDWDIDGTSSSPGDAEHELLEERADQNGPQINSAVNPFAMTSAPSQPLWSQEPDDQDLRLQVSFQCIGTDCEIIHELRSDVAMLLQRMDDMQTMLQKCMEMQLELQRSVRQEVSAALNRYACPTDGDACDDSLVNDKSKWDKVRKGICCLCCDNSIDALLYRCGHMCTCLKCAEKLMECKAKCPICRAPVIEVIRAFSIQ